MPSRAIEPRTRLVAANPVTRSLQTQWTSLTRPHTSLRAAGSFSPHRNHGDIRSDSRSRAHAAARRPRAPPSGKPRHRDAFRHRTVIPIHSALSGVSVARDQGRARCRDSRTFRGRAPRAHNVEPLPRVGRRRCQYRTAVTAHNNTSSVLRGCSDCARERGPHLVRRRRAGDRLQRDAGGWDPAGRLRRCSGRP